MATKQTITVLNYTTEVSASKTIGEIQALLAAKGALSVSVDYEQGEPSGVTFKLMVLGKPLSFRLPADPEAAFDALYTSRDVPNRYKTKEQAKRVCWRIMLRWCEAQLALVQLKQASFDRAFFQYALDESTGMTVYEHWLENRKSLQAAPEQSQLRAVNE
jgi:hypothetical protein